MELTLEREELYREVWSRSVGAVARKYDLTEGDVRKACFALDVPRPARGYWTRLKTGDAPPATPLPQKKGASTYTCKTISRAPKEVTPKKPAKPKETLVEWILKSRAAASGRTQPRTNPPPYGSMHILPEDAVGLPSFIPLRAWVILVLGEHAPHKNTILRWVRDGRIYPQPVKVGKQWMVRKDAAYLPD